MTRNRGGVYLRVRIWWIRYSVRGKRHRESSGSAEQRVAEKLLLKRELEGDEGKLPNLKALRTTLGDLCDDYLRDYRVTGKKSVQMASGYAEALKKRFGASLKAADLTTDRINRFVDSMKDDGYADATVNRFLSALKRMYRIGMEQDPPKVLRIPKINMLRERNVRTGFFEHADFLKLRAHLPEHLRAAATLAYSTGMRRGEVFGLNWDRVSLPEGVIRLEGVDTKNNEPRTIFLNPETSRLLEAQKLKRDLEFPYLKFVFFTASGEPVENFRRSWKTACEKAGLPDRLFHDFRRTAVRNMTRAGVPETVAMRISGHRTRSVFSRYDIVSGDDLRRAAMAADPFGHSPGTPEKREESEEKEPVRKILE